MFYSLRWDIVNPLCLRVKELEVPDCLGKKGDFGWWIPSPKARNGKLKEAATLRSALIILPTARGAMHQFLMGKGLMRLIASEDRDQY